MNELQMKVPKDLSKFKITVVGNFTLRQIICAVIAAILDVIVYFTILKPLNMPLKPMVFVFIIVSLIPMVFILEVQEQKFEIYLSEVLWRSFTWPRFRIQKNEIEPIESVKLSGKEKKERKKEVEKLLKEHPEMRSYD